MSTDQNSQPDIEAIHQKYLKDPCEENLLELVEACKGLVFHYAKLYGGGYSFDDLSQAGYEGLLKTLQNFDPSKGVKFVTYASHGIIGEIRHYVRRERRYYYPDYLNAYQERLDEIVNISVDNESDPISTESLAEQLNLKPDSVQALMGAGIVHMGHLELSSIKARSYENFTLPIEDKILISQLKYHLTDIQKDVIEMLFNKEMTQEEVAKELGLTQKQVSRIKIKSLRQMKEAKKD